MVRQSFPSLVLTALLAAAGGAMAQGAPPTPAPAAGEVVVMGRVRSVVHKIDRTVYDLRDNLQAESGSVADVLNTLPSVNVDPNGNISVRGASVQVMVDGRPSPALKDANLATVLQSMPANTVARIEVVTNPGPEFRTDAATVINIITRKTRGSAPSVSLIVNAGAQARYNAALSGAFGVGKWTFNGTINLRQDRRYDILDGERITKNPDGSIATDMVEHRPTRVPYGVASASGEASYMASDRDVISFSGNVDVRRRPRTYDDGLALVTPAGEVIGDSDTSDHARQFFNDFSAGGTYLHKGRAEGETLTVAARHEEDDTLRDAYNDERHIVPAGPDSLYRQLRTERELTDDLSGDYVRPWSETVQIKAGFDVEFDRDQAYNLESSTDSVTGVIRIDPDLTNRFSIDRTLKAAYLDYQHSLGKWQVEGGLRVETMLTRMYRAPRTDVVTTSNTQWSPSLYISRDLTPQNTINLSYSHRIDRPSAGQLDPQRSPVVAQSQFMGNPYLQPGLTRSFEAAYVHTTKPVTFSASLYARRFDHQIIEYSYFPHPGDTILVSTYENAGRGHASGLDLALDLHPSTAWGVSISSDIMDMAQSAPAGGRMIAQSILTQQTKLNITYTPVPNDTMQLQAQVNGNALTAHGVSSGYAVLNLSYRHKFSARLRLVVSANDVLNSVHYVERDETAQFRQRTKLTVPGDIVYIGLDYRFGAVQAGN